ncbi:hypothetical protein ACQ69O_005029, partial [Escherichia coli]
MSFIRKNFFLIALGIIGIFIIYFGITSINGSAEKESLEKEMGPPPKNADVKMLEKIEEKI